MANPLIRFEVDDTVVLHGSQKSEPNLLGRVARTYHALDSHDPLEDCLIIAYIPIDTDIIQQFTISGRPPRGYVFVEFAHEEAGHALLPEESVTLLSRALAIGDTVKQDANTAMFGTVIDIQSSYVLAPICLISSASYVSADLIFSDWMTRLPSTIDDRFTLEESSGDAELFLYGISGSDLRRAEDFQSGDHVVSHDWFGVVEASDIDVAVLLDNETVVWVEKPWELEIVVTNPYNKPLVSLPEFDDIRRPDILNVDRNGITSMPPKRLGRGDAVVTNRRNIERGRWLEGEYDMNVTPRGRVLDVRTRRLDITWLVPNAFVDPVHQHRPSNSIRPYENLTSFRNARDLRMRKDLARYSHDRKPKMENSFMSDAHAVSAGDVYYPGDRVRFNNKIKSKDETEIPNNRGGEGKNKVENTARNVIPRSETYDFDLNEYMVCVGYHEAVVLWQNGTTSNLESTKLTAYSLPELDYCPGDLVMAREGLKMIGVNSAGAVVTSEFNEMSFFEKDHILEPSKVGVIQSVDAQERLARVRWYADPHIRLGAYGQVLQQARFGKIGEDVEDVSLYEIMTEPAFDRKRGDMVVIPPRDVTRPEALQTSPAVPDDLFAANPTGPTTLSYLRQISSHVLPALWEIARPIADMVHPLQPSSSLMYDWIGEIVNVKSDGSLTVRLGSLKDCKDISISQDDILLIVDENAEFAEPVDDNMDVDLNGREYANSDSVGSSIELQSDDESAIDEIVEYEGGERLDNESGEDEWSTDDDTPNYNTEMVTMNEINALQDTQMGGTASDGGRDDEEPSERRRRRRQAHTNVPPPTDTGSSILINTAASGAGKPVTEAPEAEHLAEMRDLTTGNAASDDRIQNTVVKTQSESDDPMQNAEVSALAQYLHQINAPASFEILEQLPPPDQFNRTEAPTQNREFLKRIAREHRILASSLPAGEIYVRTYESRLDLLRCLIIGPADTPYEHCPFVIDLHLGPYFPKDPPKAHFHSWTSGLGRINPNLYEEGKICLSLLGTWPGQSEQEGWSDKATLLQVLISLQGLVFVSQPFYNEAGFETYGEEKVYSLESQQYSEKSYVMARGFVKYALLKAPGALEDVLTWIYLCSSEDGSDSYSPPRLLLKVIERAKLLMERSPALKQQASLESSEITEGHTASSSFLVDGVGDSIDVTKTFLKPLSQGALVMLKKIVVTLENIRRNMTQ